MDAADELPNDVPILHALVRALRAENAQLKARVVELENTVQELRAELATLRAKLDQALQQRFGRRSERTKKPPRPTTPDSDKPLPKRHRHGRAKLPDHLERRDTILDLTPEQRGCPCCGQPRVCIGEQTTEQLDCEPKPFFVRRTIRKTYACQHCDPSQVPAEQRLQTASPTTVGPLDKGLCGPGLLADVLVSKFLDHLPLHRQADIIARSGVRVALSTLGDWVRQAATLLSPLYRFMHQRVLTCPVLWSDDTRSRFAQPGQATMPKGYFWVTIGDVTAPYTLFHFTTDYSAASGPDQFLAGFQGYLHADCLAQYDGIVDGGAQHVACWAHARRKFLEAGDGGQLALEFIQQLYRLEHSLPPPDTTAHGVERQTRRLTHALPLLTEFKNWLDTTLVSALPKSPLGRAVRYVQPRWPAFVRYTEDGRLAIDNNLSERTLRMIAVGRNNWKFLGSAQSGDWAAIHYTLTGTCRHLGLDPFAYLRETLTAMHLLGEQPTAEQLTPWLPDYWATRQQPLRHAA
jgi:transposase